MKECANCGFLNDYGCCSCPSSDKWYACPIENKKAENIKALQEYAKSADMKQPNIRHGKGQEKSMSVIRLLRLSMIQRGVIANEERNSKARN